MICCRLGFLCILRLEGQGIPIADGNNRLGNLDHSVAAGILPPLTFHNQLITHCDGIGIVADTPTKLQVVRRIREFNQSASAGYTDLIGLVTANQLVVCRCHRCILNIPAFIRCCVGICCKVQAVHTAGIKAIVVGLDTGKFDGSIAIFFRCSLREGQHIAFANGDIGLIDVKHHTADSIFKLTFHNQHIAGNDRCIIADCPFFQLQVVAGILIFHDVFPVSLGNIHRLSIPDQLDIFRCCGIIEGFPVITEGNIIGLHTEIQTGIVGCIPAIGVVAHHTCLNGGIHRLFCSEAQAVILTHGNDGTADAEHHIVICILELAFHDELVTGLDGEIVTDSPGRKLQIILGTAVFHDRSLTGLADIISLSVTHQLNSCRRSRLIFHIPAIIRNIVGRKLKVQTVIGTAVPAVGMLLHIADIDLCCQGFHNGSLTVFKDHIALFDLDCHIIGNIDKAAFDHQNVTIYNGFLLDGPECQIIIIFSVLGNHFCGRICHFIGNTITDQLHIAG